ncbi:monovalent cation/H(+) antiporter subunit G [Devosia rhodophyticola]|uniref:Monovalent cation/H(+) antiporter subunit G n=1 Tax=Devosia rhodophyticola TaxID=3026423 RepID=A0ABY7YZ42_9HYPH|nr:monovalent cation/H(+) antiporter subunit G [Devosia rhodophyticola]WDR06432.1 monovalent cation/H(+) antiporter subunit G [Devosia rhodophyticola]
MIVDLFYGAAAIAMVVGALFVLLAAIGIVRFPDLYTRMHAASMAGSVGCGLILLAVALVSFELAVAVRAILGIGFLLLTTPVSAHLLARSSLHSSNDGGDVCVTNELSSEIKTQL